MKYTYISAEWNIRETDDVTITPDFLEKIDNTWFEKRCIVEIKKIKKEVEIKDVDIKESIADVSEDVEAKAKEYLKEKKVRGYALLKGQKIIDRAVVEGFIL